MRPFSSIRMQSVPRTMRKALDVFLYDLLMRNSRLDTRKIDLCDLAGNKMLLNQTRFTTNVISNDLSGKPTCLPLEYDDNSVYIFLPELQRIHLKKSRVRRLPPTITFYLLSTLQWKTKRDLFYMPIFLFKGRNNVAPQLVVHRRTTRLAQLNCRLTFVLFKESIVLSQSRCTKVLNNI